MSQDMSVYQSDLGDVRVQVRSALDAFVTDSQHAYDELTVIVQREHIVEVLNWFRDECDPRFDVLIDLCGVDYPRERERFEIVYHLLSMAGNLRVRVKLRTDEAAAVPSVCGVYPNADWYEREAFDMYGVVFSGHPDLRRILTDYGFSGYPLRKDFPMTGYVEVRYDEEHKRVVYEPVKLRQEFRNFDFLSPWEGAHEMLPGDEKAGEGQS
jgi:NADH-quinone oxidoreductase subunit C